MRKLLKWLLILIGMLLVTILLASGISSYLTSQIDEISHQSAQAYSNCPDIMVVDQINEGTSDHPMWRPIPHDDSIRTYCIEPGVGVPTTYNGVLYTREQIEYWGRTEKGKGCMRYGCVQLPHLGYHSTTYFYCDNEHYTESDEFTDRDGNKHDNLYEVGYILSYNMDPQKFPNETIWHGAIQQAVWLSPVSRRYDEDKKQGANYAQGLNLYQEALKYQTFYEKIMEPDENGKTGAKPKDLTNKEELALTTNQETKVHTLGPFTIDYINGFVDGISFGGISDMYLIGTDENGNTERIDIKAFIRTKYSDNAQITIPNQKVYSNYGEPRFFTNYDLVKGFENVNLVDYWAVFEYYPDPGEEFYVEFEYTGTEFCSYTLHVDFKWIECEAEMCLRYGRYWYLDERYHYHLSDHMHGLSSCSSCYKALQTIESGAQDALYVVEGNRFYATDYLEIPIDIGNGTNTMKIGGFVYEDYTQTKENITNGIKDVADIALPNVEVALYDAETNQLAELVPLAREKLSATSAEINDKDDYTRRINPTLTDENGYYEFRGVSTEKKYYVKFTYNGQSYIATDYLASIGPNGTTNYSYSNVQAMVQAGQYDGPSDNGVTLSVDRWKETSKGTEKQSERDNFDERFESIGSSPNNYETTNSLNIRNYLESANGTLYNETFHTYELAGFTLNSQGKYEYNANNQLVDTYLTLQDGYIIDTRDAEYKNQGRTQLTEGLITKAIKAYIDRYKQYPTNLKTQIYQQIAGNNEEIWRKLQYIEDTKIHSYTKSQNVESERAFDTYPVYNQFTTYVASGNYYPNNSYSNPTTGYDRGTYGELSTYANRVLKHNGDGTYGEFVFISNTEVEHTNLHNDIGEITYRNIYPGQLEINQGLVRRQEYDVAIKKDVYKATVKINGRTEIYGYNEREIQTDEEKAELKRLEKECGKDSDEYLDYQLELENRFWEIQERIIGGNYDSYYGTGYTRELYESDYEYDGNNQLEAYITYKITIRNQSQSILAQIDEVVDYYDSTYEFMEDMSWIMYDESQEKDNRDAIRVKEQDFYDIMVEEDKSVLDNEVAQYYKDVQASTGIYANNTKFNNQFATQHYKTVYINGLKTKPDGTPYKMKTGETAYIYLTFKIRGEGNGLELETEASRTSPGKQNIAEINGYSTFYADGTRLPNNVTKNSNDPAGLVDKDSNPGNFTVDDLNNRSNNNRYEQNFEDDADRARGLTVTVEQDLIRKINGTVWEDKRTYQSEGTDALVGNGIRENGEVTISGIKVELHEVVNGVTQDEVAEVYNGSTFVPAEATTDENGYYYFEGYIPGDYVVRFIYGGEYNAYYNGQDYKSTSYQQDHINDSAIDQNGRTDVSGDDYDGYLGYTNYNSQNESATFGYSINKSDEFGLNLSDAKDIWDSRQSVNDYSSESYGGVTYDRANTLDQNTSANQNTQMIAETGVIRMEFEYNRQSSEGNNTYDNNGYWTGREDKDPMDYEGANNTNENYYLQNVDFGLEERPKAGLELNKQISNIRVVLANQNVLFDANEAANNLVWEPKVPYNINDMKENSGTDIDENEDRNGAENIYSDYATRYNQLDTNNDQENRINDYDKFRKAVQKKVNSVVSRQNGILQVTMDEELMHGATIEITYNVTVTNIGEEDYNETQFYYIGEVSNRDSIVTTSADVVMDYVPNNMQFRTDTNNDDWGWGTITQGEIGNNGYVSPEVSNILSQYNTIITTQALNEALYPLTSNPKGNTQDSIQLILTQTITPQNSEDDMSYDNIAEIVQISNDVGRRMAYSVQGNQDPTDLENLEVDSSKAERVVILPPFGEQYLYLGLGIFIVAMIGIAVIVIRKVVLNKNRF